MPAMLGTTYTDRFIMSIHQAERKIVLHHSPAVLILRVHEARSETVKNNTKTRQDFKEVLVQWETLSRHERKYIVVFRRVAVKQI